MPSSLAQEKVVWFLVGPFDTAETIRYSPIYTVPFVIGRRQDLALTLNCKTVSGLHAEITAAGETLVLQDLGSTNGTYVNGRRVTTPVKLHEEDIVQFANVPFRIRQQAAHINSLTVQENVCDQALALVQFDKLMADRAVTPFFQPIVAMPDSRTIGFEVLGRSRLFGLEMPSQMFHVAEQLNMEVELSAMLRWEGVASSGALPNAGQLFVNTHPRELAEPGLIDSLQSLRKSYPSQRLTLEIHESAVTDAKRMTEIRAVLSDLQIGLAYDDFGAGQARLNELVESPPDVLKFDMSLIRDIDAASPQRQQLLAMLVQMVRNLGIVSLAEGIETRAESETCSQMGFELAQGYYFGRPAPPKNYLPA